MHMGLTTQRYLAEEFQGLGQPPEHHFAETGWPEVRRGLNGILLAYLLCVLCLGLAVGLVVFVMSELTSPQPSIATGDLDTILYAGGGVLFLLWLGSFSVLVRNKCRCVMNAPEREGARWWMF